MSTFIPFRVGVSAVALFLLLLAGCNSAGTGTGSELVIPQVESTYQNFQACYEFAQPKGFVEPGLAMSTTVSFYGQLASASTGALSRGFEIVASQAAELSPYYEADVYPPEEMMTNFQGAIYAVELLCGKVLNGSASSSESTITTTNESDPSDSTVTTTNDGGIYANKACNYVAQKIYFDPWGWDIYDIKADAEIDFGKTIGGSSYGMDSYLRNSFNKYIKIYNAAFSMTSDGMVSGVFKTIANTLQEYIDTHDPIPYPDFEQDFDEKIIKLVSISRQWCDTTTETDDSKTTKQTTVLTIAPDGKTKSASPTTTAPTTTAPGVRVNGYLVGPGANLQGANLQGANLAGLNLSGANLIGANLIGANLQGSNLSSANLYGANLGSANLRSSNLRNANFTWAELNRVDMRGADIAGTVFTNASYFLTILPDGSTR